MESRSFIIAAKLLINKIETVQHTLGNSYESQEIRKEIATELNALFAALYNPTLPSAFALRDIALQNGFHVDQRVLNNLSKYG